MSLRYLYHISDIHIRLNSRRKEYEHVFDNLYNFLETQEPGVIIVTGDVVHNKIELQPECILLTYNFFRRLGQIMPTFVIAGNHDALLHNRDRLDSLSSIFHPSVPEGVVYLRSTGVYRHNNLLFVVNSLLDDEPWIDGAEKESPEDVVVGLFHGQIGGWVNASGYTSMTGEKEITDFHRCDVVLLGDIHKHQFMNQEKTIAYAGSLISQNFGETDPDHGVLVWDVEDLKQTRFHRIHNPYRYREFRVLKHPWRFYDRYDQVATSLEKAKDLIPAFGHVRLLIENEKDRWDLHPEMKRLLGKHKCSLYYVHHEKEGAETTENENLFSSKGLKTQEEDIVAYLKENISSTEDREMLEKELLQEYRNRREETHTRWELESMEWENLFGYGGGNRIDLTSFRRGTVAGIFGENSSGKSSIIDILTFLLFHRVTRMNHGQTTPPEVIHHHEKSGWGEVKIRIGTHHYLVRKTCQRDKHNKIRVSQRLYEMEMETGTKRQLTEEQRKKTDKVLQSLIGGYKGFLYTNFFLQQKEESFRSLKQAERKDFLYEILRLDWIDEYRKTIEERHRGQKTTLRLLEQRMSGTDSDQWTRDVSRIRDLLHDLEKQKILLTQNKEHLSQTRDGLLSGLHPCRSSTVLESLIRKTTKEIHETSEEISVFRTKVKDLEDRLRTSKGSTGMSREETIPEPFQTDPWFVQWKPDDRLSEKKRREWQMFFREKQELKKNSRSLFQQWDLQEKEYKQQLDSLEEEPFYDPNKVLKRMDTEEEIRVDTEWKKMQKELRMLETRREEEQIWLKRGRDWIDECEKVVRVWETKRSANEQARMLWEKASRIEFNPRCKKCMMNPFFLEQESLLKKAEEASRECQQIDDQCRRLFHETMTTMITGATNWGKRLRESQAEWKTRSVKQEERDSNILDLQKKIRHHQEVLDCYEHTRRFLKAKDIRESRRRLENEKETHASRYRETQEVVARWEILECLDRLWSDEPQHWRKEYQDLSLRCEQKEQRLRDLHQQETLLTNERSKDEENKKIHEELKETETKIKDIERTLVEIEHQQQTTREEKTRCEMGFQQWEKDHKEWQTIHKESEHTKRMLSVMDRDGLPLYLLKQTIPRIERDLQRISEPFLKKKICLRIHNQEIQMGLLHGEEEGEEPSVFMGGMESFIVDLSLKLCFSRWAVMPISNVFFIDEGISVLDTERLHNLRGLFDFLCGISDHVFLISHIPLVRDFVQYAIHVEKDYETTKSRLSLH